MRRSARSSARILVDREMDAILLANFMLFHDVVRDEPYDLWIGDEAWELDYFLRENPRGEARRLCLAD